MNLPYFWYAENKKYASQMYYNQYGLAIYASRGDAAGITNYDVWMLYKKNS